MSPSATCSDRRGRRIGPLRAALLATILSLAASPLSAKVLLTQQEALALAFPGGAAPERITSFLTDGQAAAIEKEAGQPPPTKLVTWYRRAGRTAWFDTHVVRTQRETLMIVVDPDGSIARIDLLSFSEPDDYLPRPAWLDQFSGLKEGEDLSLRGRIRPITGATLSARAIVTAARRTLAARRLLLAEAPAP